MRAAYVISLSGRHGDFRIDAAGEKLAARTVLLATGVSDSVPVRIKERSRLISSSRLRLCPICDAYELIDQPIFVLGSGEHGAREALYLRSYSAKLVLFLYDEGREPLPAEWRDRLRAAEIEIVKQSIESIREVRGGVEVALAGGALRRARAIYAALGVTVHSALATALGARCDGEGYLEADRRQQTTVPGLYAAGDVVQSLSQISVGFGQAAIAASAIHESLNELGARRIVKRDAGRDQGSVRSRSTALV
jgi:thioredoxin reductase (NADPH)